MQQLQQPQRPISFWTLTIGKIAAPDKRQRGSRRCCIKQQQKQTDPVETGKDKKMLSWLLKLKSRCDIEGCRHKDDDVDVDANNVLLDVCKTFLVNDENLN